MASSSSSLPSRGGGRTRRPITASASSPPCSSSLLEEIEEGLAQSLLIFLLADLRLMSATGRVATKFETLALDSDVIPRSRSVHLGGVPCPERDELFVRFRENEGISPAQVMALLLLEIHRYVEREEEDDDAEDPKPHAVLASARNDTPANEAEEDAFIAGGGTGGKNEKRIMEDDMHALLKAYSDMIGSDLVAEVPHVSRRFMSNVGGGGKTKTKTGRESIQLVKQRRREKQRGEEEKGGGGRKIEGCLEGVVEGEEGSELDGEEEEDEEKEEEKEEEGNDDERKERGEQEEGKAVPKDIDGEEEEKEGKKEEEGNDDERKEREEQEEGKAVPKDIAEQVRGAATDAAERIRLDAERIKVAFAEKNAAGDAAEEGSPADAPSPPPPRLQRQNAVTRMPQFRTPTTDEKLAEVADAVFSSVPAGAHQSLHESLRQSALNLGAGGVDGSVGKSGQPLSGREVKQVMERAVESRIYGRLDFMADFFKDGTTSETLAKSRSRIVWMNDWYPLKDLTYAISVDAHKRRILVVFRGAITRADWGHVTRWNQQKVKNPISELYQGRTNHIGIFEGFYRYLFRRRKDTSTTKYDEISNLAHKYGIENIGEDYTLMVTGMSLGGALTTTFGFFASAEERFTKNGPVTLYTYGAPYVGGRTFANAFRRQEVTERLRLARVFNDNDVVAHLPANVAPTKTGSQYEHVGLGIKLPRLPSLSTILLPLPYCLKWRPLIFYVSESGGFAESYLRALKNNAVLHCTWPWMIRKKHTLQEHQKRIYRGTMSRINDDNDPKLDLLGKTLDELYDMFVLKKHCGR